MHGVCPRSPIGCELVEAIGTIVDDGNDARSGYGYLTTGYDLASGFMVEVASGVIVFIVGDAVFVSITGTLYVSGTPSPSVSGSLTSIVT